LTSNSATKNKLLCGLSGEKKWRDVILFFDVVDSALIKNIILVILTMAQNELILGSKEERILCFYIQFIITCFIFEL